jgi:hypothetical protein
MDYRSSSAGVPSFTSICHSREYYPASANSGVGGIPNVFDASLLHRRRASLDFHGNNFC